MRLFSLIGGLITYPEQYVKIIIHEDPPFIEALFTTLFFQAMYTIGLIAMIHSIINSIITGLTPSLITSILDLFLPVAIPLAIIAGVIIWVVWSAATHLTAKLFGGTGEYIQILKLMGFTWFTLTIPIIPILTYPLAPMASIIGAIIFTLISFGWMVYINYHGVKEIYGVGGSEGLLALLLPILLIIILTATIPSLLILFTPMGW